METRVATTLTHAVGDAACTELADSLSKQLAGAAPALVLVFASTKQPLESLSPGLAARFPGAVVLGASTAGEFTERGAAKGSAAAIAIAGDYRVFAGMASGLAANAEAAITEATRALPKELPGHPHRTAILLLDPLAGKSEEATLLVSALMGEDVPFAGGAAGDDLAMKSTHVSLGGRTATDAVVVAEIFSKRPLGLGVCHGHRALSTPLRVTKAAGAVIHEIEGRPAWDVWKERTRESAASRGIDVDALAAGQEGGYLLQYEAGLAAGSGYKIRAPLSRSGGSISFACEVPEGAVIRITESDADSQISSAREAGRRARAALGDGVPAGAIVFDCICRNLILGQKFDAAVESIGAELGGVPLAGFETYGEIALAAGDMSGFHNTTSVVLAFPR